MISNDKLRPYLFAFLAFCVLSSKHIIIYNEELLVALSFLAFILFVFRYFGNTVKESLDERRLGIQSELERFFLLKRESLEELTLEHEKVFFLRKGLVSLKDFAKDEARAGAIRSADSLKEIFSQQIVQKLLPLSLSTLPLQSRWQEQVASSQLAAVLVKVEKEFQKDGKHPSWDPKIIERALSLLKDKTHR